jgi:hypothetical protein
MCTRACESAACCGKNKFWECVMKTDLTFKTCFHFLLCSFFWALYICLAAGNFPRRTPTPPYCHVQASSGLFTDYHWRSESCIESSLAATLFFSKEESNRPSAAEASCVKHNAWDVWMGVDCYGRGTWGGGKMNSCVAVQHAAAAGTSVALFAAAWAFAEHGPQERAERNHQFWSSIFEACDFFRVFLNEWASRTLCMCHIASSMQA